MTADAYGWPPLFAGDTHDAAEGLHQRIVARPIDERTLGAEGRQVAIDEPRILATQTCIKTELAYEAWPHVLQHNVGLFDQETLQDCALLVVLEIDRH